MGKWDNLDVIFHLNVVCLEIEVVCAAWLHVCFAKYLETKEEPCFKLKHNTVNRGDIEGISNYFSNNI